MTYTNQEIEILKKIEQNPVIYLGQKSLVLLKAFISGYSVRLFEEDENHADFFSDFQKFVSEKYNVTTDQGWAQIIGFFSGNDIAAFDRFFELFEEYLTVYQNVMAE